MFLKNEDVSVVRLRRKFPCYLGTLGIPTLQKYVWGSLRLCCCAPLDFAHPHAHHPHH